MQQFTVHYSQVCGDVARRYASEGSMLFALWPSPVNHDVCFREAGFTDFADGDETWDAHADGVLTRLLAELSSYGPPHLVSKPAERLSPGIVGLSARLSLSTYESRLSYRFSGTSCRTALWLSVSPASHCAQAAVITFSGLCCRSGRGRH